jgi:hypothetical protein
MMAGVMSKEHNVIMPKSPSLATKLHYVETGKVGTAVMECIANVLTATRSFESKINFLLENQNKCSTTSPPELKQANLCQNVYENLNLSRSDPPWHGTAIIYLGIF